MNLLVIDDDRKLNRMLCEILEKEGYTVKACTDGEEGAYYLQQNAYDLALVDWMLPGESGPDILRESRRKGIMTPVVMLTALTAVENKVTCLDAGADDYLTKPFRIPELRARVNAHIRREQRERHSSLNFERIRIDLSAKTVQVDGEIISLTKSEYMICEFLARNKGQVFTREQIYEAVFSLDGESDNSTIATHIKNIRAKLNQYCIQPITTVWGIGYKWE